MPGTKKQEARKLKTFMVQDHHYKTTEKSIARWFNILNKLLFDEKIPHFNEINIRKRKSTWSVCESSDDGQGTHTHKLHIDREFPDRRKFVNVLAHEMVHVHQYDYKGRPGHGPSFWCWKDVFEKHGLFLKKEY